MTFVDQAACDAIRKDLESTLVVEATAGTGKTTEMIARSIQTIGIGTAGLEQIVALTFDQAGCDRDSTLVKTAAETGRIARARQ